MFLRLKLGYTNRELMRGYSKLNKSKGFEAIRSIRRELAAVKVIPIEYQRIIYSNDGLTVNSDIVIRQLLLSKLNDYSLLVNKLVLSFVTLTRIIAAFPRPWLSLLTKRGVFVNRWGCEFLFSIYTLGFFLHSVVRDARYLLRLFGTAGVPDLRRPYVFFPNLMATWLPTPSVRDDDGFDNMISWFIETICIVTGKQNVRS